MAGLEQDVKLAFVIDKTPAKALGISASEIAALQRDRAADLCDQRCGAWPVMSSGCT